MLNCVVRHEVNSFDTGNVLVLRFITGDYAVPLGVWVTREATRKAMNGKPIIFSDKELMLKYFRPQQVRFMAIRKFIRSRKIIGGMLIQSESVRVTMKGKDVLSHYLSIITNKIM